MRDAICNSFYKRGGGSPGRVASQPTGLIDNGDAEEREIFGIDGGANEAGSHLDV